MRENLVHNHQAGDVDQLLGHPCDKQMHGRPNLQAVTVLRNITSNAG